ncbi:hypothetical protein B9479_007295 [Cryptococcus floricola]|uniref:Uncharacterized protein n=1 Tax=Cryptococcus floricola TaxID=2591691 RepID=A0A5D3AKT1_9TREE|nr:hypothetical protein B9479_007295 [Cryptococcus floricola]
MSCYYGLPAFYDQYRESNLEATIRFLNSSPTTTFHYRRRNEPVGYLHTYIGKGSFLNAHRVSVRCCAFINPALIGEMDKEEIQKVMRQGKELEKLVERKIAESVMARWANTKNGSIKEEVAYAIRARDRSVEELLGYWGGYTAWTHVAFETKQEMRKALKRARGC